MSGSTIPTFKAAIVAALQTAAWPALYPPVDLGPVLVSYGQPAQPRRERVVVGDTGESGSQEWMAFDASRHEMFDLEVQVVSGLGANQTCQQAVERAFALLAVVESVVRTAGKTPPAFGVTGAVSVQIAQPSFIETATAEGWVCEITTFVRCEARITP